MDDDAEDVRLSYASPYDWSSIIEFLAARAIPGVELVEPDRYQRTIELNGEHGTIAVSPVAGHDAVAVTIRFPRPTSRPWIVERIRSLFDLDADVGAIAAHLETDTLLAPLVRARPGLRVPGAWDPFELAIRAVLGQQITVGAARGLIGRLLDDHGERLRVGDGRDVPGLSAVFPTPERLAAADLGRLPMPRARQATLSGLAVAAAADADLLRRGASLEDDVARLTAIRGIGEWTAQYIALRAFKDPDAFPAADIGLICAMTGPDGLRPAPADVLARAEAWRPLRAYAAQHLWASLAWREIRILPNDAGGVRMPLS